MLTTHDLLMLIEYQPDTGHFFWKARPVNFFPDDRAMRSWNTRYEGKKAGTINKRGYIHINLMGKMHYAHRLAFYICMGYMPQFVDHINQNKSDNRIANLREATESQNQSNKSLQRNSSTGIKGVSTHPKGNKTWRARIQSKGKQVTLGYFKTKEEAEAAYQAASVKYHGEFASAK